MIEADLERALNFYRINDIKNAKDEIQFARYHGFKNTGLESMIKKEFSYAHFKEIENGFQKLESLVNSSVSYETLHDETQRFLERLHTFALSLPEIVQQGVIRDWYEVVQEIHSSLQSALSLYGQNLPKQAISKVQSTYFDIFEESGMEQAILLLSEDCKLKSEQRFRTLSDMIKQGESKDMLASYIHETYQELSQLAEILTPKELHKNSSSTSSTIHIIKQHSLLPWLTIASLLAVLLYRPKRKRL
ncbi:MAG: hypothetical protein ACTTH5_07075 [Wolinella sp.]